MTIERSTVLDAPSERVWKEVNRPDLLRYVAWPLLTFEPVEPAAFPERWAEREYRIRMRAFGLVPLGWQVIGIERPAPGGPARRLRDDGRGTLARRWDHLITVEPAGPGRTRYTDRVEIEAGLLTPFVGVFAWGFYAHRQRRWRRLVDRGFQYDRAPSV